MRVEPINLVELPEEELADISGARGTALYGTLACCWCVPWYSGYTKCGFGCQHPGCS